MVIASAAPAQVSSLQVLSEARATRRINERLVSVAPTERRTRMSLEKRNQNTQSANRWEARE